MTKLKNIEQHFLEIFDHIELHKIFFKTFHDRLVYHATRLYFVGTLSFIFSYFEGLLYTWDSEVRLLIKLVDKHQKRNYCTDKSADIAKQAQEAKSDHAKLVIVRRNLHVKNASHVLTHIYPLVQNLSPVVDYEVCHLAIRLRCIS